MTLEFREGRGVGHNKDYIYLVVVRGSRSFQYNHFLACLQVGGVLHSEEQSKTYSEHVVELLAQSWSRSQAHPGHFPAGEGRAAVSRRVVLEILPLKTRELLYYEIGRMNLC